MANFWQKNDDNIKFWDWFFQVEEISETPLHEDESLIITQKNVNGEQKTFPGVHLKSTLQKKSN